MAYIVHFLLNFRSLAAIVSEKSTVFIFSYRKAKDTKFDLQTIKFVRLSFMSVDSTYMPTFHSNDYHYKT